MQVQIKKFIRVSKDVERLAQITLHTTKEELFLHDRVKTSLFCYCRFRYLLAKINRGLPLEYVLNSAVFMGKIFYVNKNVLIPRPETEMMVLEAESAIVKGENMRILEIGCGSGAITASLAKRNPENCYFATDVSAKALAVARRNAKKIPTKISFRKADLLEGVGFEPDIILANLPYLTQEQTPNLYDPKIALVSPRHDSYLIEKLLDQCVGFEHCTIILEIGHNQGRLKSYAQKLFPQAEVSIKKDFNDYDRLLVIRMPRQE